MLQYERIYVSEGSDINKSDKSKECMNCHHWYFKDIAYKYINMNHLYVIYVMIYQWWFMI